MTPPPSTSAGSTLTLSDSPEPTLHRHSALDVVSHCSTQIGPPSCGLSDKELFICLLGLVAALQGNVMSRDVWWLSHHAAAHMLESSHGITPEQYRKFKEYLEVARQERFKANPMSGLF